MKTSISFILLLLAGGLLNLMNAQNILHVGPGQTYQNPAQAALQAKPGDTILLHPASYNGPFFITNLKGNSKAWITIRGLNRNQVIFQGGSESIHFTDPEYLYIRDMTITGQTGNGMNIDDGGSFNSPAKHLIIDGLIFRNMAASGNNDMLKLSGLDSFVVSNCHFENGSAGGSGIDMVGCHYGQFVFNRFINQGSNSIQAKGGSSNIHIERNYFTNGGLRALNLGGSTGVAFFRPANANYEAKDLLVTANVFEGSDTPIAFVGCRNAQVINNTIIQPLTWIMRILQESADTSFYQSCANNLFSNNIVVVNNTLRSDVNIGPYTSPASFNFSNNLWFHLQNSNWNGPQLPVLETNGIIQRNPLFIDLANKNYRLADNSPAIGKGKKYAGYQFDFNDMPFANPPTIGAIEKLIVIKNDDFNNLNSIQIFPNPFSHSIQLENLPVNSQLMIFDILGQAVYRDNISEQTKRIQLKHLIPGIYSIQLHHLNEMRSIQILKLNE